MPSPRPSSTNWRRRPHPQPWGHAKTVAGAATAFSLLLPAHLAHLGLRPNGPPRVPRLFHKFLSHSLGIRTVVHGKVAARHGVLFVSNHLSWADIPVLGSRLLGHFVAKAEVGTMGFVSVLADLQRTIYVERERRLATGEQRSAIVERLQRGGNVILFPEGTSSDGVRVLPFKSALFSVVDEAPQTLIQPVSIAYTRLNGLPVTRRELPDIAWIGDMEFGPHALDFMRLGRIRAEILLHPPVRREDFADRKSLSRHCHALVAEGYARLMRG